MVGGVAVQLAGHDRRDELVLRREAQVDQPAVQVDGLGDVAHRQLVVAEPEQQLGCGIEDRPVSLVLVDDHV